MTARKYTVKTIGTKLTYSFDDQHSMGPTFSHSFPMDGWGEEFIAFLPGRLVHIEIPTRNHLGVDWIGIGLATGAGVSIVDEQPKPPRSKRPKPEPYEQQEFS